MTQLPKLPTGDSPFVTWCKQMMQCVRERTVIQGQNVTVDYTVNGVKISAKGGGTASAPPAVAATIKQCSIDTISYDSLQVTEVGTGTSFRVALPWKLRKTGWHGASHDYTFDGGIVSISYSYGSDGYRTATINNSNPLVQEPQAIIPIYREGDIIFAVECANGSGVSGSDWLDLNVDARAWARY